MRWVSSSESYKIRLGHQDKWDILLLPFLRKGFFSSSSSFLFIQELDPVISEHINLVQFQVLFDFPNQWFSTWAVRWNRSESFPEFRCRAAPGTIKLLFLGGETQASVFFKCSTPTHRHCTHTSGWFHSASSVENISNYWYTIEVFISTLRKFES